MKIRTFGWFKPVIWVVELAVIISLLGSIISIAKKRDIVGERAAALMRVQHENERLKRQLSEAESTSFVEREARDKLGLVKPGEVVVMVGKGSSTASGSFEQAKTVLPRWQQWWQLFF